MSDEIQRTKKIENCIKYKLNFLVLVLVVYFSNAILYEITQLLPLVNHHLFMSIDDVIPFIPEFTFFYTTYYLSPIVFLYLLSFYDKKKLVAILFGGFIGVLISFVVYLIYNVQMIRPEELVNDYWFFNGSIHSIHDFFLAVVHFQYIVDPLARNGIPSLHAMFSSLMFVAGMPLSKKDKHAPTLYRILAITFGLGTACSTFLIKQHYFIDAVVGFALGITMYFVGKFVIKKIGDKHKDNNLVKLLGLTE